MTAEVKLFNNRKYNIDMDGMMSGQVLCNLQSYHYNDMTLSIE